MFRSIVVIAMLAAGDAALISKPTMKPKTEPPRALAKESNVLTLRGGGMIDQGMWMKAFSVFMGLYGVGFVLAPGRSPTRTDTTYDKYHIFISRMAGAFMLTVLYRGRRWTWPPPSRSPTSWASSRRSSARSTPADARDQPAHKAALLMIPSSSRAPWPSERLIPVAPRRWSRLAAGQ